MSPFKRNDLKKIGSSNIWTLLPWNCHYNLCRQTIINKRLKNIGSSNLSIMHRIINCTTLWSHIDILLAFDHYSVDESIQLQSIHYYSVTCIQVNTNYWTIWTNSERILTDCKAKSYHSNFFLNTEINSLIDRQKTRNIYQRIIDNIWCLLSFTFIQNVLHVTNHQFKS